MPATEQPPPQQPPLQATDAKALLEFVLQFGRIGLWERDARTMQGRWDGHALRLLGLDESGAAPSIDQLLQQVLQEDREAMRRSFLASLAKPGLYDHHYRIRAGDGSVRWLHSQWQVLADAEGRAERALGMVTDDTRAMQLSQQADEALASLRLAAGMAGLGVWRHDLASQRIFFNDESWSMLGLTPRPEGMAIDEVRQLIHPDDLPQVLQAAEQGLRTGLPVDHDARYRRTDGQWRRLLARRVVQRDATGQAVAYLGVTLDMTERFAELERASQASRRTELAAAAAGVGIWSVALDRAEVHWSEHMHRLHGLPLGEAPPDLRAYLRRFMRKQDHASAEAGINRLLRGELQSLELDMRVLRADGQPRLFAVRAQVERGVDGTHLFGMMLDVTERRAAEDARAEQLRQASQGQARSRLLARMSHELRTPLNAIIGLAQLLQDGLPGEDAHRRGQLRHIRAAGAHLLSLVDDVLELTQAEADPAAAQLQPLALQPLLEQCAVAQQALADERSLTLRVAPTSAWVLADPALLRRALHHLLADTLQRTRPGTVLQLHAQASRDADVGGEVRLMLDDPGRALPLHELARAFEPFSQTGPAAEGASGVSLSLVQTLVQACGGSTQALRRGAHGLRLELRLRGAARPGAEATAATRAAAAPGLPATGARAAQRLLYIEDNPVNALIVQELVQRRGGLEFSVADTGTAGVNQALALVPDVVLVDMQLPDMDGFEVLRRLRGQLPTLNTPCIALSANALPEDIQRALDAGFADYWTKPVDFRAFLAGLDRLFGPRPG